MCVKALSVAAEFGVPFATIFGNHDDQQYRTDPLLWHHWVLLGTFVALVLYTLMCSIHVGRWLMHPLMFLVFLDIMTRPNTDTSRALLKLERQAYPRLSHTGDGDNNLMVRGTHSALALYFLDTGGRWIPEAIRRDQLNWLKRFDPMPSLAFMHIPPLEMARSTRPRAKAQRSWKLPVAALGRRPCCKPWPQWVPGPCLSATTSTTRGAAPLARCCSATAGTRAGTDPHARRTNH